MFQMPVNVKWKGGVKANYIVAVNVGFNLGGIGRHTVPVVFDQATGDVLLRVDPLGSHPPPPSGMIYLTTDIAMAVPDTKGCIILLGTDVPDHSGNTQVQKLTSDGTHVLWTSTVSGPTVNSRGTPSSPEFIAMDGNDNVICFSPTNAPTSPHVPMMDLVKLSGDDGSIIATDTVQGDQESWAASPNGSGVSGGQVDTEDPDFLFIANTTSSFFATWDYTYTNTTADAESANGIAVSADGSVYNGFSYVYSDTSFINHRVDWLVKFSESGGASTIYNAPLESELFVFDVDSLGNAYCEERASVFSGGTPNDLVKIGASGGLLWRVTFPSTFGWLVACEDGFIMVGLDYVMTKWSGHDGTTVLWKNPHIMNDPGDGSSGVQSLARPQYKPSHP